MATTAEQLGRGRTQENLGVIQQYVNPPHGANIFPEISLPSLFPEACEAANSILDTTSAYVDGLQRDAMDQARHMDNHIERIEMFKAIYVGRTALNSAYQISTLGFVSDSTKIVGNRWARIVDAAYLRNEHGYYMPTALRAGIFAVQTKRGSDFGEDAAKREGTVDSIFIPPGVHVFYGRKMHKNGMVIRPYGAPFAVGKNKPEPLVLSNFTQGRSRAGFDINSDDFLGYPIASKKSIEAKTKLVMQICGALAAQSFPKRPLEGRVALPKLTSPGQIEEAE